MRPILMAALALMALPAAAEAQTRESWDESDLSMTDALESGFEIKGAFTGSDGLVVFVLQRSELALMCYFQDLELIRCDELTTFP